ncbi:MAG: thioredoxin [Clostridia bacterium]|nr:thioredoxin [Clostridia bacterium]
MRSALLVLGVGAVLYGALSGGWLDVLTKAINICTECIGLG